MKDNLEYKILRFLKNNENGKYTSLNGSFEYNDLLEQKISTLLDLKYISSNRVYIENTKTKVRFRYVYKIEFKGVEYLDLLENSIIEKKLSESNIKANELNEKNSNFNKWTTISNIIIGLLNIGLLIWQILKD